MSYQVGDRVRLTCECHTGILGRVVEREGSWFAVMTDHGDLVGALWSDMMELAHVPCPMAEAQLAIHE